MTELEKLKITELYALGNGYKKIGRLLGIPSDSVKTYIRRHGKGYPFIFFFSDDYHPFKFPPINLNFY